MKMNFFFEQIITIAVITKKQYIIFLTMPRLKKMQIGYIKKKDNNTKSIIVVENIIILSSEAYIKITI